MGGKCFTNFSVKLNLSMHSFDYWNYNFCSPFCGWGPWRAGVRRLSCLCAGGRPWSRGGSPTTCPCRHPLQSEETKFLHFEPMPINYTISSSIWRNKHFTLWTNTNNKPSSSIWRNTIFALWTNTIRDKNLQFEPKA